MVKGAALFLQQGSSPQGQRSLQHPHKHAGKLVFSRRNVFPVLVGGLPVAGGSCLLGFKARAGAGPACSESPSLRRQSTRVFQGALGARDPFEPLHLPHK